MYTFFKTCISTLRISVKIWNIIKIVKSFKMLISINHNSLKKQQLKTAEAKESQGETRDTHVMGGTNQPTFFIILFCLWKNSTLMSPHTGSGWGNSNSMCFSSLRVWAGLDVWILTLSWYTTNWGSKRGECFRDRGQRYGERLQWRVMAVERTRHHRIQVLVVLEFLPWQLQKQPLVGSSLKPCFPI